jgi:glycogen synthase
VSRVLLTTDVVGGVWDFCVTLASGLRAVGDDVVLLAIGSPTLDQRQSARAAGAQLVTAPLKLEWMRDSDVDVEVTPSLVAQVARQVGADVVHANQFAAACAEVEVPLVLTIHSDVLSWRRWTLGDDSVPPEWRGYAQLLSRAVSQARSVVAVSRFLADEVTELYGVNRPIGVVHNAWPAAEINAAPRERTTLVAGRIWDAAKNIPLVADAAHGWDPGPVYLAGEQAHPDGGTAAVPQPLRPLGFLNREELDGQFDRAKVYISAARYDPFGLLPLQAALHGCELLLSDIPSYREVWGTSATYFRSGDADHLRAQWAHLLSAQPNAAAQTRAREQFSVKRLVESYRALYAELREVIAV